MIKYVELKSGYSDDGPAWIGRVRTSRTGRTIYFNGRALKQSKGPAGNGNYVDVQTGEIFWVSGVKRSGPDRHPVTGRGKIVVEAAAVSEYLALTGKQALDPATYVISEDIVETDPAEFVEIENQRLRE